MEDAEGNYSIRDYKIKIYIKLNLSIHVDVILHYLEMLVNQ